MSQAAERSRAEKAHAAVSVLASRATQQAGPPLWAALGAPIVVWAAARLAAEQPERSVAIVMLEGQNHFLPWNSEGAVREALRVALERSC